MEAAYAWFLGVNDTGVRIADAVRGASHDGLTASGPNLDEGAESTLMWLMALEHVRGLRTRRSPGRVADPGLPAVVG